MFHILCILLFHARSAETSIKHCLGPGTQINNGVPIRYCTLCSQGYLIDSNQHCDKCDEDKGYVQDTSKEEFTCKVAFCDVGEDHCLSCSTDKSCSKCEDGYELTGPEEYKNCLKCAPGYEQEKTSSEFKCIPITCTDGQKHCTKCLDDNQCQTCEEGYTSSTNQFKTCDSCAEGYDKKVNGNDFECVMKCDIQFCQECNSPNNCKTCQDGYFLDIRGSCLQKCEGKIDHCIRCETSLQNEIYCTQCDDGYGITNDKMCREFYQYKCDEGNPNTNECVNCKSGYYLKSGSCHPCPKVAESCQLKKGSDTEIEIIKCDIFYYLDNDECKACPDNCDGCELNGGVVECTSCDIGYELLNGRCSNCPNHCSYCTANEDNTFSCNRCEDGFARKDGECEPCSQVLENCGKCDLTERTCSDCLSGFYFTKDKDSCLRCPDICGECRYDTDEDKVECDSCAFGYYQPPGSESCVKCPEESHCSYCTHYNNYYCNLCQEGYFQPIDGVCEACPDNCLECYPISDDLICLICDEFSELEDSKCKLKTCDTNGMDHCSKCRTDGTVKECILCDEENYEIAEDKLSCKIKPCDTSSIDNCNSCEMDGNSKRCTQCSDGYTLAYGGKYCLTCDIYPDCIKCTTGQDQYHLLKCLECANNKNVNEYGECVQSKFVCICKDETSCNACISSFGSNDVDKTESITSDPGEGVSIKVFSDVSISSTIFIFDHNIEVASNNVLTLTNVQKVDVSDTTKLKVADHLIFENGQNVIIQPSTTIYPEIEVKLSTIDAGKSFTINLPDELTTPLKLDVKDSQSGAKAPKINVQGKGEINSYNYPFEQIEAAETVKVIKGIILICSPQENGEKCNEEEILNYKVLKSLENINENLETNTKILFYLQTFTSTYLDIDINKLNDQDLILASTSHLLEGETKLRVLSTAELHSNNKNVQLKGSTGSTAINYDYATNFIVGYNDQLNVLQDEELTDMKPQIKVQAQKKESTIVFDNSIDVKKLDFYLDSIHDNTKVTIYVGDKLNVEDIMTEFSINERKIPLDNIEFKSGSPSSKDPSGGGGGLGTGGIIGIVVAIVVVAVIIGVVVFFVIRKRKNNNKSSEGEYGVDKDNI